MHHIHQYPNHPTHQDSQLYIHLQDDQYFDLFSIPVAGNMNNSPSGAGGSWMMNPNRGLKDPMFGEDISNVTVTAGREAILSCVVDDLGDFGVSRHVCYTIAELVPPLLLPPFNQMIITRCKYCN